MNVKYKVNTSPSHNVNGIRLFLIVFLVVNINYLSAQNKNGKKLLLTEFGIESFIKSNNEQISVSWMALDSEVTEILKESINVPIPVDGGGGFSHEQHKRNYTQLYKVALSYSISNSDKKLDYIKEMFAAYATLYPTLGKHPLAKPDHPGGRLFWQGLNETVWLFYTIQSYDLVKNDLSAQEQSQIENAIFKPMASFISEESYETFNKIHNHGTWSVASVGMTGIVLGDTDMLNRAIYGSKKDGKTGFIAQLEALFSNDGFYAEGPYYHRYAILPFIAFADAIEKNRPDVKIFELRDQILNKAVASLLQLTDEQGRFYPLNDAIKSKTWESDEVIFATNIAYAHYKDERLLPVIKLLSSISFTDAGIISAKALTDQTSNYFTRPSLFLRDGVNGDRGGISLMRSPQLTDNQLHAIFKFSTQGMGHGHFDRLSLSVYDYGEEIIPDYGAARFLNIEAKSGGRYLPENKTYAQQSIAHSAIILNNTSHYEGNVEKSESYASELVVQDLTKERLQVTIARDTKAYEGKPMERAIIIVNEQAISSRPFIIDIASISDLNNDQVDINYPFYGNIIETDFDYTRPSTFEVLGNEDGYKHLQVLAVGQPKKNQTNTSFTFLQAQRFYTITSTATDKTQVFLTQTGANDPDFNLNLQQQYLLREKLSGDFTRVSIIEPHGYFNPLKETVTEPESVIKSLQHVKYDDIDLVKIDTDKGEWLYMLSNKQVLKEQKNTSKNKNTQNHSITYMGKTYNWTGTQQLIKL